jgi:AcrR family transcriptional regulator
MASEIGLRERLRRQTSADIRGAAVRLVRERGFDKLTIEAICAEAGISVRTFFNYFPNKESAIAYGPSDIPPELVEEFVAAGRRVEERRLVLSAAGNVQERRIQAGDEEFHLAGRACRALHHQSPG